MKIGDYLYCLADKKTEIRNGDAVVGLFEVKKHEKFEIVDINSTNKCLEINYFGITLWFSLIPVEMNDYPGFQHYKDYFVENKEYQISIRKEKLKTIYEIQRGSKGYILD